MRPGVHFNDAVLVPSKVPFRGAGRFGLGELRRRRSGRSCPRRLSSGRTFFSSRSQTSSAMIDLGVFDAAVERHRDGVFPANDDRAQPLVGLKGLRARRQVFAEEEIHLFRQESG